MQTLSRLLDDRLTSLQSKAAYRNEVAQDRRERTAEYLATAEQAELQVEALQATTKELKSTVAAAEAKHKQEYSIKEAEMKAIRVCTALAERTSHSFLVAMP